MRSAKTKWSKSTPLNSTLYNHRMSILIYARFWHFKVYMAHDCFTWNSITLHSMHWLVTEIFCKHPLTSISYENHQKLHSNINRLSVSITNCIYMFQSTYPSTAQVKIHIPICLETFITLNHTTDFHLKTTYCSFSFATRSARFYKEISRIDV